MIQVFPELKDGYGSEQVSYETVLGGKNNFWMAKSCYRSAKFSRPVTGTAYVSIAGK